MAIQSVSSLTVTDEVEPGCELWEHLEVETVGPGDIDLLDGGFLVDDERDSPAFVAGGFAIRGEDVAGVEPFLLRVDEEVDYYEEYGLAPGTLDNCSDGPLVRFRIRIDNRACIVTVTLRILLQPDEGVVVSERRRDDWVAVISAAWSDNCKLVRTDGRAPCEEYRIVVNVQWTALEDDADQIVRVSEGSGRDDMVHWYLDSSAWVAAHEFGHMLGNIDEYDGSCDRCPDRPVKAGLMNDEDEFRFAWPRYYYLIERKVEEALCSEFVTEHIDPQAAGLQGGPVFGAVRAFVCDVGGWDSWTGSPAGW